MPKKRLTREESKARTRTELMRAANRLFLRDGFVATSLAAIAEEAGLTKGAVYSNFESKEDLFLALLQEQADDASPYAPSDVDVATGATAAQRAERFGRYASNLRPSRRHIALFLEMNAAALRSDRTRKWVDEHNHAFFDDLGGRLKEALDLPAADPALLGVIAQSLYVGLLMHGGFSADVDDDAFAAAYRLLASLNH